MSILVQKIREELAKHGPIPFARFMELALYCPDYGFYETEGDKVGRGGDFYTSVSVGPLFGELLAFQFATWFASVRPERRSPAQPSPAAPTTLQLIEAGAHDGQLAADILHWLQRQRPDLFARTEYCLLEPSARRRQWQQQTLAGFAPHVRWLGDLAELGPADNATHLRILFSNELLDAFPVRRFGWDAANRTWFEWGVTAEGDRFVWTRLAPVGQAFQPAGAPDFPVRCSAQADDPVASALPTAPELLAVLPDGYTLELSPAAEQWWSNAAHALGHGKLVTFDYGFEAPEFLSPGRTRGTLRAYRRHQRVDDVLADPGQQDITAHVNFTRIEQAGLAAGWTTDTLEAQGRYLTRLAAEAWKPEADFGAWDARRTRQFQTLTHPHHLGQSFRVLIQSRACMREEREGEAGQ
jgi:SAM-dependent MidA family methyltransferase